MISSIAQQSMSESQLDVKTAMNIGLTKKVMNDTEDQAMAIINDMMPATPAPSPYGFDTYA